MKLNVEPINRVAEFGSGFNALWHGTIMETDVVLWPALLVPTKTPSLLPLYPWCHNLAMPPLGLCNIIRHLAGNEWAI